MHPLWLRTALLIGGSGVFTICIAIVLYRFFRARPDAQGESPSVVWRRSLLSIDARNYLNELHTKEHSTDRLLMMVCAAIMAGSIAILLGCPSRLLIVPVSIGTVIPLAVIRWMRKLRLKKLERQLPGALQAIANVMITGASLEVALQHASQATGAPLGTELMNLSEALRLGISLDDALEAFAARWETPHLRFVVSALRLHARVGGNISAVLLAVSNLVRERSDLQGQVQALTAEARLSGTVLIALPVVAFIAMSLTWPDYIQKLFDDPLGQQMLAITVFLQVVGAAVIRRMVVSFS